jgi:single-strand DNA-binding protein
MSGEAIVRVTGNAGGDAELRFTPSGKAVASFSLANTPRVKNGDQWEDGDTLWLRVTAWGNMAEAVAENITKGTKVLVVGRLTQQTYTVKDTNEQRTSLQLTADEIGVVPRWQTTQEQAPQRPQQRPVQKQGDPWAGANDQPPNWGDPPF